MIEGEELTGKYRTLLALDDYQGRLRQSDPEACIVRKQLKIDFPQLDKFIRKYKDTRLKELVDTGLVQRVSRGRCATYEVTIAGHDEAVSKRNLITA